LTYCLGIRIREGLICLADGRITAGTQVTTARKMTLHGPEPLRFAVMTSGLRSLRDKTMAYLDRAMRARANGAYTSMLDAVSAYAECLRRVAVEDGPALAKSELGFDLNAIVAGHLPDDPAPTMFQVYPEGNWIEVEERTPYLSIGATAYGKPILDRALRYETSMPTALKLAYLSFDSTRFSSTNVGYPIDMATYATADKRWRQAQYDYDDLREQRTWWNENITQLASRMPDGPWLATLVTSPVNPPHRLSIVSDERKS
jgi:putative proteasome-type protease